MGVSLNITGGGSVFDVPSVLVPSESRYLLGFGVHPWNDDGLRRATKSLSQFGTRRHPSHGWGG